MGIKIGCCGFSVRRQEYAAHLPVVEVQQTFYQPLLPATALSYGINNLLWLFHMVASTYNDGQPHSGAAKRHNGTSARQEYKT